MSVIIPTMAGGGGGGGGGIGQPLRALTAHTTWYVNADSGDDTSGDGSSSKPFKTPTRAWNEACKYYLNGFDAILQFMDATSAYDGLCVGSIGTGGHTTNSTPVGGGNMRIQGNASDPTKVVWSSRNNTSTNILDIECPIATTIIVNDLTFGRSDGSDGVDTCYAVAVSAPAWVTIAEGFFGGLVPAPGGGHHIIFDSVYCAVYASGGGTVQVNGHITIKNTTPRWNSLAEAYDSGTTYWATTDVTLIGNPHFSRNTNFTGRMYNQGVLVAMNGVNLFFPNSWIGTATGPWFACADNGTIQTSGEPFPPGTTLAGSGWDGTGSIEFLLMGDERTVANLPPNFSKQWGFVTDALNPAIGYTPVGGGTSYAEVVNNGSGWFVTAILPGAGDGDLGMPFIASGLISNQPTFDITLPTGYNNFHIRISGVEFAAGATDNFGLIVSYDNGASFYNDRTNSDTYGISCNFNKGPIGGNFDSNNTAITFPNFHFGLEAYMPWDSVAYTVSHFNVVDMYVDLTPGSLTRYMRILFAATGETLDATDYGFNDGSATINPAATVPVPHGRVTTIRFGGYGALSGGTVHNMAVGTWSLYGSQ